MATSVKYFRICRILLSQKRAIFLAFSVISILGYLYLIQSSASQLGTNEDKSGIINITKRYQHFNASTSTSYAIDTSTCRIPDLNPWHESIRLLDGGKCSREVDKEPRCRERDVRDWFHSNISHLIPNYIAIHSDGYSWNTIRCCFRIVERVEQTLEKYDLKADSVVRLSKKCYKLSKSATLIHHEFIKVFCISTSFPLFEDVVYRQFFAFARMDSHAKQKVSKWKSVPQSERPPNVILLGIDTNSRLNTHRQLHKTFSILRKIGATEMFGFTKVGENTFPNAVGFLTGISMEEMAPYCMKTWADAQDDCPYVWRDFDRVGYLTATVEDVPVAATFNYYKAGFVLKPTDFYYKPFSWALMLQEVRRQWYVKCIGHRRCDEVQLNYLSDILQLTSKGGAPVFIHSWSTTCTHGCIHHASYLDEPLAQFMRDNIENSTNTFMFFMSDHGDRYGSFHKTALGWYENRLPSLWVYMSPDLREMFPGWEKALQINARRLTSHFDLYHTMIQILATFNKELTFNESYGNKTVPRRKGQSLLEPVPENRTCEVTVKASKNKKGKRKYIVESLNNIMRMNKITRKTDCVENPVFESYCYCT